MPVTTTNNSANNTVSMSANTILGNNTGATDSPIAVTHTQVSSMYHAPTSQKFTSGSGTYTTPAGCVYIKVYVQAGGGGGAGLAGNGSNGSASSFGTSLLSATGGQGANSLTTGGPGAGGVGSGGNLNLTGCYGGSEYGVLSVDSTGLAGGFGGAAGGGGGGGGGAFLGGGAAAAGINGGGGGGGCG